MVRVDDIAEVDALARVSPEPALMADATKTA